MSQCLCCLGWGKLPMLRWLGVIGTQHAVGGGQQDFDMVKDSTD